MEKIREQKRPDPGRAWSTPIGGSISAEEAERTVVDHRDGSLLVLGGPGSGKTTLLEKRFLALSSEEGLAPHRILLLCNNRTYSTNARDRLFWDLPCEASVEVPVYTWHALAYHLVGRYHRRLGYREQPVLLTSPEQWGGVRELLSTEDRSRWGSWGERIGDDAFVDEVADFCLRVQQRMMTAEDLAALAEARPDYRQVVDFAGRYRRVLLAESKLDYPTLLAEALRLLSEDADVRRSLIRRFPHVLVDDAQEMGLAQIGLLGHLSDSLLCVAADPDSGIEKFRGAEPDWVYGFLSRFPGSEQVVLPQCHRIGYPFGPALSTLASQNDPDEGYRPSVWASGETKSECFVYRSLWEEAEAISREFRRLHVVEGVSFDAMAILLSQPARLLPVMQRALQAAQVPYHSSFADRSLSASPAVRWFLDLAGVAVRAPGWQDRLPDLLSSQFSELDVQTRRRLEREAWQAGRTLAEHFREAPECGELRMLCDLVSRHSASAHESFWRVWRAAPGLRKLAEAARAAVVGEPGAPAAVAGRELKEALQACTALSHTLERFVERRGGAGSINDFLKEAVRADFGSDPWTLPRSSEQAAVEVSSFHASKGREWDYVAVAGCLDAWIPKGTRAHGLFDPFALEIPEVADRQIEALADDRRTFYVAASRARLKVLFTCSAGPGGRGRPSRFLTELFGKLPEPAGIPEMPPLSIYELVATFRRTLAHEGSSPAERVAALIALSEAPGVDPFRWYGIREWTPGSVPLVDGKLRTSYSRLSPFENCGLQGLLQSVLGLDHESTHSMKFGTWIHALFEAVHKGVIRDPSQLQAEYARLFDDKIFPNRTVAGQFRKDGEKMLKIFWENEVDRHTVESEHAFEDLEVAGASIRGRIDRIDVHGKALKLTDYKTAKWAPSFRQAERSLQLAIYHLAARTDPRLRSLGYPEIARLVYPGATTKKGGYQVLNQNAEQADKVLEELPGIVQKILDEDFRPNPEADCYFCKMKMLCPLWPAGNEVPS